MAVVSALLVDQVSMMRSSWISLLILPTILSYSQQNGIETVPSLTPLWTQGRASIVCSCVSGCSYQLHLVSLHFIRHASAHLVPYSFLTDLGQ